MGKKNRIPSAAELRKFTEGNVVVDSDDDEEIDEDEAFDSSDEKKYAHIFGSKKKKQKSKANESDSDSEEDDESEGDGSESGSDGSDVDNSDDDDDDESEDDGIASDDDDEEGDGGDYMLSLLDKLTPAASSNTKTTSNNNLHKHVPESEFSSSVVQSSNITMDQLMSGISDTKGFTKVQKSMKDIIHPDHDPDSKKLTTTLAPVARIVSERTKRKVHYEHQKKDIQNWSQAVGENRKAESLDFRPKDHIKINKEDMVSKFEPETDFEKQIHAVLEAAGAEKEEKLLKSENEHGMNFMNDDDLGEGKLTAEQYQARQGQLAKMRALMFYEEQKRHHMNKIKSKKYRKIRKNQRERLKDADMKDALETGDEELLNEMKEKEEMERMEERMSLAHKNTSKWAKRQLKRGKALDLNTRRALSAQLQKGQDLKKKMEGIRGADDSDDSDNEGVDEDQRMIQKAKSILKQTEQDIENGTEEEKKGLFKMNFMQKGLKLQRERAKAEAQTLLEELEGDDSHDDYDDLYNDDDDDQDWKENNSNKKKEKDKVASTEEIEKVLPSGKLVVSGLEFGKSNSIAVDGNISIDLPNTNDSNEVGNDETDQSKPNAHSQYTTKAELPNVPMDEEDDDSDDEMTSKTKSDNKRTASIMAEAKKDSSSNPWLDQTSTKKRKLVESKNNSGEQQNAMMSIQDSSSKTVENENNNDTSTKNKNEKERATLKMSQEELVRKAFAAPTDLEVEEEFQKEKVCRHKIILKSDTSLNITNALTE